MSIDSYQLWGVPTTMRLWFGGGLPLDWDKGPVWYRDGTCDVLQLSNSSPWSHRNQASDIVGYTSNDPTINLSHEEQYIVEQMAKAAHHAHYVGSFGIFWDVLDPEECQNYDPDRKWPDDAVTYVGARGFRACALAAYLRLRELTQIQSSP